MPPSYVVLDDDPTGTQAVRDVPVFLRWKADEVRGALATHGSVHLETNGRALTATAAREVNLDAARTAVEAVPEARIVLRGDSTLRAHLLPEYLGVVEAAYRDRGAVLMLVPALPAAGRVTRGGVHYDGAIPVHETAYARDGVFAYRSSRLLEWADDRTDGLLAADRGIEVGLERLRADGPDAVLETVRTAAAREHAVVVPDAETSEDLELIAAGARGAYAEDLPLLVRAAPAFAGVLTETRADEFVPAPHADRLLVVCGSYVARTTAQLTQLYEARGIAPVELDLRNLLGSAADASAEIDRAARAVGERLAADRIAVLATPRERPPRTQTLEAARRVVDGAARVLRVMPDLPDVILAKGGVTSHVTLTEGLGCDRGHVVGPIAVGVAHWRVTVGERELEYLIFPGNVGGDDHLATVVAQLKDH